MTATVTSRLSLASLTAALPSRTASAPTGQRVRQLRHRQNQAFLDVVRHARPGMVHRRQCVVAAGGPSADATPVPVVQGKKLLDLFPEENVVESSGLSRAHHALRSDCAALMLALSKIDLSKGGRYADIFKRFLDQFVIFILMHHDVEDNVLFPALMQLPMAVPGVPAHELRLKSPGPSTAARNAATPFWADMVDEHEELLVQLKIVAGALDKFARAEGSSLDVRAKQAALEELRERVHALVYDCVLPHLSKEELVIPQIYRLRLTKEEFAAVEKACATEAGRLAGPMGLAWIVHALPADQRDGFLGHVPPPVAEKIKKELLPKLVEQYYQPLLKVTLGEV
eukprot:jgi/Mesvir1/28449/Mv15872-RA.2